MVDRARGWKGQRLSQRLSWALQLLITHFYSAYSHCPPHSRYNVERQGCETGQPENKEGDGLKLHFPFSSGFRLFVCKIGSLGFVGTPEVPQAFRNNCESSLAMCLPKCGMRCLLRLRHAMRHPPCDCQPRNGTPRSQHGAL